MYQRLGQTAITRISTNVWYDTTYTNPVPDENENNGSGRGKRHGDEDAHRCAQERCLVPVVNLLVISASNHSFKWNYVISEESLKESHTLNAAQLKLDLQSPL